MVRNVKVLLAVTFALGFMQGVFELIFPFYLDYRGLSLTGMGVLYTLSFCVDEFIQIFAGDYSDSVGRKKVYSAAFILGGTSNALFPSGRGVFDLAFIKILHDTAETIRRSVSSVMIFENAREAFSAIYHTSEEEGLRSKQPVTSQRWSSHELWAILDAFTQSP